MQQQGCHISPSNKAPRYKELAKLLKMAFDDLDKAFTEALVLIGFQPRYLALL